MSLHNLRVPYAVPRSWPWALRLASASQRGANAVLAAMRGAWRQALARSSGVWDVKLDAVMSCYVKRGLLHCVTLCLLMGGSDYKHPRSPQTSTDLNNPGGPNRVRENLFGGGIPEEPINPKQCPKLSGLRLGIYLQLNINKSLPPNIKTHPNI